MWTQGHTCSATSSAHECPETSVGSMVTRSKDGFFFVMNLCTAHYAGTLEQFGTKCRDHWHFSESSWRSFWNGQGLVHATYTEFRSESWRHAFRQKCRRDSVRYWGSLRQLCNWGRSSNSAVASITACKNLRAKQTEIG